MPILRLAIASPLRQYFDYLPPEATPEEEVRSWQPGTRLAVPFGSREVCGILLETLENSEIEVDRLRPAHRPLDSAALISDSVRGLCLWAIEYYKHPPGEVLALALPTRLREVAEHQPTLRRVWRLTVDGRGLGSGALARAPRQAELLALLQEQGEVDDELLKSRGIKADARRSLEKKGLLEAIELEPTGIAEPETIQTPPALTDEQQLAVDGIVDALGSFRTLLLEGVTGSGKTEVYLRAVEAVLQSGRQALVLVPEIGLTPQTIERFRRRFKAGIALLHSGLADGERYQAWEAARSGQAHIVIGTRSSIFCSLARPGVIVVDEEHDISYKQQDGFRYSARDLAVKRGQLEGIPVILGSATPSFETLHNAESGKYDWYQLNQRISGFQLPAYEILDVRHQQMSGGLSQALRDALGQELGQGNQVLLFLNRRGFAPILQCHDCGFIAGCRHCDARLTLHRGARELRCHHCGWRCQLISECPDCHSRQLASRGVGTEQTESVLEQEFPDYPLYRVDRDSMQRRGAMDTLLERVNSGEPCVLLGTQMLTKGHHFPGVTLVGLLDVDGGLFSTDFRGAERLGQLLTQVGGRAGREGRGGRVILQTHYPDHPLLTTLIDRGYREYANMLMQERQTTGLPPYGRLAMVRADASSPEAAEKFLTELRRLATPAAVNQTQLVGPLPAPLHRRGGRYRSQLLLISETRAAAQRMAAQLVALAGGIEGARQLRWSIDIDPQEMN